MMKRKTLLFCIGFVISIYNIEASTLNMDGCTNPEAHNYDSTATTDDGSCMTCEDGVLNGDEEGIDCGGELCEPCQSAGVEDCNRIIFLQEGDAEINSSDKAGDNMSTLVASPTNRPKYVSVHESSGRLIYYDEGDKDIKIADLSGINAQGLISGVFNSVSGLLVDNVNDMIYWSDRVGGLIRSANIDGSNVRNVVVGLSRPYGLALDTDQNEIYWAESGLSKIRKASTSGGAVKVDVVSGLVSPRGLAIDSNTGKIYWTDAGNGKVQRANLDGSNIEDVVSSPLASPYSLALDLTGQKLYCTAWGSDKILKMNLDGSNVESMLSTATRSPNSLSLSNSTQTLYWVDWSNNIVKSADFNGGNYNPIFSPMITNGLVKDDRSGYIYFTDAETNSIRRTDNDGSNQIVLITDLENPSGLALDKQEDKLYWTDIQLRKILKSNLDGTNIEEVIGSDLTLPLDLDVDEINRTIYWTDTQLGIINKADLDGNNREIIVETGIVAPEFIKVDAYSGLIFWTDPSVSVIRKADLNGGAVQTLVNDSRRKISGIAIDPLDRQLYWTDAELDQILKVDYDRPGSSLVQSLPIASRPGVITIEAAPCFDITEGDSDQCLDTDELYVGSDNSFSWLASTDATGEVSLLINPEGNELGFVQSSVFVDGEDVRFSDDQAYGARNIRISSDNDPNTEVSLRLFFKNEEIENLIASHPSIATIEDIFVSRSDLDCDVAYDGSGDLVIVNQRVAYGSGYFFEVEVSQLGNFNLVGVAAPLAVQFGDIYLSRNKTGIQIDWVVASEIGTDYYRVERSQDGTRFEEIARVQSVGGKNTELEYSYLDKNPLEGINYYRLKEIDNNGNFSVSEIRAIFWFEGEDNFVIYPNPVADILTIDATNSELSRTLTVLELSGKTLIMKSLDNGVSEINLEDLPQGMFLLKISNSNQEIELLEKLVKK